MEETNFSLWANPFPAKVVESNIVKIKGHNFTGVYPSPVLMKLDARKCIILSCFFLKNKLRLFSHFSVILPIVKNEWLATNSQNAILNNFEEYYKMYPNTCERDHKQYKFPSWLEQRAPCELWAGK